VLRDLGRLDDALAQYDETIQRFPKDRVALTAKANVLIELKHFDQALSLLSEDSPSSRDDWIDLHVRGMAHLRRGDDETAVEVFERGVRDCPFSVSVAYFRNALAVTQLGQKKYAEAASTLGDQPGEIADVLRLHAEGEQGHEQQARAAHQRLLNSQRIHVIQLRDQLAAAFLMDDSAQLTRTADWYERTHEQECKLVARRIAA
jgi:tetratricopeptide (TPR) repeat protein